VLLTDGQTWSGVVEDALKLTRARDIPVFVVGVGTLQGGVIPDPKRATNPNEPIVRSALDRTSLNAIAATSGGRYLELDRDSDQRIALQIVDAARRRASAAPPEPSMQPVYWPFLFAAACLAIVSMLFLRDRSELWLQVLGGSIVLAVVTALLR
jgi:hypothetical protein